MNNKRTRNRFKYDYSVLSFECKNEDGTRKYFNRPLHISLLDISYSGIGIVINQKLVKGEQIFINLSDGFDRMEYILLVKWCTWSLGTHKAGCEFSELTEEKIRFLDKIIKNIHSVEKKKLNR